MTNITFIALAYKMVALQLMLGEANFFSKQLDLPTPHPIQITNLIENHVSHPRFGFGGALGVTNFGFYFKQGKLWSVSNQQKQYGNWSAEWNKSPSLIDKEQAYQLTTQWLSAVFIDVPALDKKFKVRVTQPFHYNLPNSNNKEVLPVYEVKWGEEGHPAINVTILGPTKELMRLDINDLSFSKRPSLVIPNADELNSRPDPVFKKLQSATVATNTEVIRLRSPKLQNGQSPR